MQLERLSAELSSLGGGTLQVSKHKVVVHVSNSVHSKGTSIVRHDGRQVILRDPRAPPDTPLDDLERRLDISGYVNSAEDRHGYAFNEAVCQVRTPWKAVP
jgi:hypothetical protein